MNGTEADLDTLIRRLQKLEDFWRYERAPVASSARPGLADGEIDRLIEDLPFELPSEVRTWFRWHNGVEPLDAMKAEVGPRFYLSSLRSCVTQYGELRAFATEIASRGVLESPDDFWASDWFPLLGCTLGQTPVVVKASVAPGERAPIGVMDFGTVNWPDPPQSLTDLIGFWVWCFEEGYYRWSAQESRWITRSGTIHELRIPRHFGGFYN